MRSATMRAGALALAASLTGAALTGCSPFGTNPAPSITPSPTSTSAPPTVYTGDEIEWLLLDDAAVSEVMPGLPQASGIEPYYPTVGESEGWVGDPVVCMPWVYDDYGAMVGERRVQFGDTPASMRVRQFANAQIATEQFDRIRQAASQCDQFQGSERDTQPPMHFTVSFTDAGEDAEVIVGELTSERTEWWTDSIELRAVHANAIVTISLPQDVPGTAGVDAAELGEAVLTQTAEAAARLSQQTVEPETPSPVETSPADTGNFDEWEVSPVGAGPLRLGMTEDEIRSALPGFIWDDEIEGRLAITSSSGQDLASVRFTREGTAQSITVGPEWGWEVPPDPAQFPTASGVAIGDPAREARERFPGGTFVEATAPGTYQYQVPDREGRVLRFLLVPPQTETPYEWEPLREAPIVSFAVEDATKRGSVLF